MIEYDTDVIITSIPNFNEKRLQRFKYHINELKFGGTIEEQPNMCIVHYLGSNNRPIWEWKIPLNIVEIRPEVKKWWMG